MRSFGSVLFVLFGIVIAQSVSAATPSAPAPVGDSVLTLTPISADCGIRATKGPNFTDQWVSHSPCTRDVSSKDQAFGNIKAGVSGGVAEFHFQLPQDVDRNAIVSVTAKIDMFCSGGLGIYVMNEIGGWARIGADLPSDQYRPDGSYGYLSCGSGQQKKMLTFTPLLNEGSDEFAFRLTEDELSAEALIDQVSVVIVSRVAPSAVTAETSTENSADGNCIANGQKTDCAEVGKIFKGVGIALIALIVFLIAISIFWLFMFIHAIIKPIENKVLWIVLLFVFSFPAAVVYYFVVKRKFYETPPVPPVSAPPLGESE